jgi:TRAP-type C4-dicarboxylate transport system permease small subunit
LLTVRRIILLASLAYLSVLVWFGINLVTRVRFQTFASMELSMGWAYAALPLGAGLAIVAVLANYLDPLNEELDNAQ